MDWKSIEPLFVTSIIGLVGWSLVEISNLKVSTAKIETELNYVRESIKTIAGDKTNKNRIYWINRYKESICSCVRTTKTKCYKYVL